MVSKLLYGLESTMLNQSVIKRLDTFLFKGLRKILHVPTTYIDRAYSNDNVLAIANAILQETGHPEIRLLSMEHAQRRKTSLAKLICLGGRDPSASATFNVLNFEPHDYGKKRVGRPRLNWLKCTLEIAWSEAKQEVPGAAGFAVLDHSNAEHVRALRAWAATYNNKHNWV